MSAIITKVEPLTLFGHRLPGLLAAKSGDCVVSIIKQTDSGLKRASERERTLDSKQRACAMRAIKTMKPTPAPQPVTSSTLYIKAVQRSHISAGLR